MFIGGVYWLSVGRMTNSEGDIDNDALLEKIQNFILRLDKDKYRPVNLESATDYLQVEKGYSLTLQLSLSLFFLFFLLLLLLFQTVMAEQYPQSLLILDDVWEPETAQVFSIRCRTMITSRNADVANGIQTNNVFKVSIMEVGVVT